jgi:TRAP-type C4-dicarboxylate transport system permease small subunit
VSKLARAWAGVVDGLLASAGLVFAAVTLLIAWDVVARNLGLTPPESTVALTEYALLYACLAAGPALVRRRGHVTVDVLVERLPPGARRLAGRIVLLASAATAFVIAALALALAVEAVARGEVDVRSLDIPRVWLFAPLVAGFGLMGLECLRLVARGEAPSRPAGDRESL